MKPRDFAELLLLAALWGASFLFMRLAVPSFGPLALAAVRVGGAALMLLPLAVMHGDTGALRRNLGPIALVGAVGSALPFLLFGIAALALTTGVMSILNATTPLWGALVAAAWLGDRLTRPRLAGMALGFIGVVWLAWDSAGVRSSATGVSTTVALLACVAAPLCYGFVANYTKKKLGGVPPLAVASGSQLGAALVLAPGAAWTWPASTPPVVAWWSALALAVLCTGVAYTLYFRLIAHVGAANATTVTFLIPPFAMLWGAVFLGEALTLPMVAACAMVLMGTALSTGTLRWLKPASGAAR